MVGDSSECTAAQCSPELVRVAAVFGELAKMTQSKREVEKDPGGLLTIFRSEAEGSWRRRSSGMAHRRKGWWLGARALGRGEAPVEGGAARSFGFNSPEAVPSMERGGSTEIRTRQERKAPASENGRGWTLKKKEPRVADQPSPAVSGKERGVAMSARQRERRRALSVGFAAGPACLCGPRGRARWACQIGGRKVGWISTSGEKRGRESVIPRRRRAEV